MRKNETWRGDRLVRLARGLPQATHPPARSHRRPILALGLRGGLKQGRWWDALREFEGAVQAAPDDVHAAKTLHQLRGQLN